MGDRAKGLMGKFDVYRRDGTDAPGGKHRGCEYFVLDLDHDPHAVPAIRAYAHSARADGYLALADDLEAKCPLPSEGWEEPEWDETPVMVRRRLLQECLQALDNVKGLTQRLESHEESGCCKLDARDRRALAWGHVAIKRLHEQLRFAAAPEARLAQMMEKIDTQRAQYTALALRYEALQRTHAALVHTMTEELPDPELT